MLLEVLLAIFVIATVVLGILLRSSLRRESLLQSTIDGYEKYFLDLQSGLTFVISEIKSIDLRGSFESDDEVGVIYKAISNMIKSLNVFITEDKNAET
jgi:hypothetical protein